jgi:hypothetical protein
MANLDIRPIMEIITPGKHLMQDMVYIWEILQLVDHEIPVRKFTYQPINI